MFSDVLASKPCSEVTNMLYLSKEGCILAGEEIAIYYTSIPHSQIFLLMPLLYVESLVT